MKTRAMNVLRMLGITEPTDEQVYVLLDEFEDVHTIGYNEGWSDGYDQGYSDREGEEHA